MKEFRDISCQGNIRPILSLEDLKKSDKFKFFTGLSIEDFNALFDLLGGNKTLSRLKHKYQSNDPTDRAGYGRVPCIDRLFLFLVRLRRGTPLEDLAYITNISHSYLGDILYTMTRHIYLTLQSMEANMFPSAQDQEKYMRRLFKLFKNLRMILDGAEFFIQRPSNFQQQGNTYSSYKSHNTVHVVIGISKEQAVTFVSPAYEGNMGDKRVVLESGLLDKLEKGDSIMTDKGFELEGELLEIGVHLYKPPALGDRTALTAEEEMLTKGIAALRIYTEHIIADIKDHRLLQGVIPITLLPVLPDLIYIAAYLNNFKTSRMRETVVASPYQHEE